MDLGVAAIDRGCDTFIFRPALPNRDLFVDIRVVSAFPLRSLSRFNPSELEIAGPAYAILLRVTTLRGCGDEFPDIAGEARGFQP
jgi:hypothetical protein